MGMFPRIFVRDFGYYLHSEIQVGFEFCADIADLRGIVGGYCFSRLWEQLANLDVDIQLLL
jgi:hypothetical protein